MSPLNFGSHPDADPDFADPDRINLGWLALSGCSCYI